MEKLLQINFPTFNQVLPVIIAIVGGTGLWAFIRFRKRDTAVARRTDAEAEYKMAEIEGKQAETQISLYKNAMEMVKYFQTQLDAAGKREEQLQQRLTNVSNSYELKISELQNQLNYERDLRQKLQTEVEHLRRELEGTGPGRNRPRPEN